MQNVETIITKHCFRKEEEEEEARQKSEFKELKLLLERMSQEKQAQFSSLVNWSQRCSINTKKTKVSEKGEVSVRLHCCLNPKMIEY